MCGSTINNRVQEFDNKKKITNFEEEISKYQNTIKEMIDIKKPTRELLKALVDKIYIDNDRNIEIVYKFNFV